jgi:hypothetical protein
MVSMRKTCFHPAIILLIVGFLASPSPAQAAQSQASLVWKKALQRQAAGNFKEAVPAFQRVLLLSPGYQPALRRLAICHYKLNDLSAAIHTGERYGKTNPQDANFQTWLAKLKSEANTGTMGTSRVQPRREPYQAKSKKKKEDSVEYMEDGELSPPKLTSWGLRIGGIISTGLGTLQGGENVETGGKPFEFAPGGGPSARVELLMGLNPWWEIGLGVHPRFFNQTREAAVTGVNSQTSMATASLNTVGLMATVYGRLPFSPDWSLETGLGAGFATGGSLEIESETIQTFGSGLIRTARTQTSKLPGGPALRASLGLAWRLTRSTQLHFGGEYFFAMFDAEEITISQSTVDETGADISPPFEYSLSGDSGHGLTISALGFTGGLTFRF